MVLVILGEYFGLRFCARIAIGAMSRRRKRIHQDSMVSKRRRTITAGAISDGASEKGGEPLRQENIILGFLLYHDSAAKLEL